MGKLGIDQDEEKIKKIPPEERCERCDGSGNELYSMYKECTDCKGTGRKPKKRHK